MFTVLHCENWLARTALLHGLPAELIHYFASHMAEKHLQDKEMLYFEGDPCHYIGLIVNGSIHHLLQGPDGRELIVSWRGPGRMVGEMALLGIDKHRMSACAAGVTRLLILRNRHFPRLLNDQTFHQRILTLMGQHMAETQTFIKTTCLYPLEARLARFLLNNLEKPHQRQARVVMPANQSQLAAMVNASRPKLNAKLQHWKQQGIIRIQRNHIVIEDYEQLCHKAEPEQIRLSPR